MNKLRLSILFLTVFTLNHSVVFAQDYNDALRYSYLSPTGTARSMALGNAIGAMGGDAGSMSINPAGLGIYKSSEFMFTPSLKLNSSEGDYLGNGLSSNTSAFNFNNFAVVLTNAPHGRRARRSEWKSVSVAFGMNRLADFYHVYSYAGDNYNSSATQAYALDAQVNNHADSAGTMGYNGYQSYLVNYDSINNKYYSIVDPSKGVHQLRNITDKGALNEYTISLGADYKDVLLLGASIGIQSLYFQRNASYSESAIGVDSSGFNSFMLNENLTTSGTGYNIKLGLIYKATDYFRFGIAFHSPTWFNLHDEWGSNISSVINGNTNSAQPVAGSYDYSLQTPWRTIISATGFISNRALISADYEYVDYSAASFTFQSPDFLYQQNSNTQIKNILGAASNFRVGFEGRVTDFFSIRLGYSYMGSPYKNSSGISTDANILSAGVGFRFDHWYLDATLAHTALNILEQPYPSDASATPAYPSAPIATIKNSYNNAAVTVGFKF